MKILMNTKEGNLKRFSKITGIQFERLDAKETENAVAIVVQDEDYCSNLETAVSLDIPVATMAGYDDSENHRYAMELGILDEAILVIQDDLVTNQGGFKFPLNRGIKINKLAEFCKYVYENDILPDIYVWTPPQPDHEDIEAWKCKDAIEQENELDNQQVDKPIDKPVENPADIDPEFRITNVIKQPPKQPASNTGAKEKPVKNNTITRVSLDEFVKQYKKVIVILKTDTEVNSGPIVRKIAANHNGLHLELNENPMSYKCYAEHIDKAIQSTYGYLDEQDIICSGIGETHDTLIIEVDTSDRTLGLLESIMQYVTHIIHLTGNFESNKSDIDSWVSMGLPIHGILPTTDENKYRKEYPDWVKNIIDVSNM